MNKFAKEQKRMPEFYSDKIYSISTLTIREKTINEIDKEFLNTQSSVNSQNLENERKDLENVLLERIEQKTNATDRLHQIKQEISNYYEIYEKEKNKNGVEYKKFTQIDNDLKELYKIINDDETRLNHLNQTIEQIKCEKSNQIEALANQAQSLAIKLRNMSEFYTANNYLSIMESLEMNLENLNSNLKELEEFNLNMNLRINEKYLKLNLNNLQQLEKDSILLIDLLQSEEAVKLSLMNKK